TGTPTYTRTMTSSATATQTHTRTASPTGTFTRTNTPVPPTATFTSTGTGTYTRTASPTSTHTPTISPTWTAGYGTHTITPTITLTGTRTASPTITPTDTYTSTGTQTFTMTNTAVPPSATYTSTATNTAVQLTSTFTRTNTVVVPSATFTSTNTVPAATASYTSTVVPPTSTATNFTVPTPGPGLLDNMADCDNGNLWGGWWYSYADGAGSVVWPVAGGDFVMSAPGVDGGADCAARITGPVGAGGSIAMGTQLNANAGSGVVTDLSGCTGIRFYAKGDGNTYRLMMPYTDAGGNNLTGYDDYQYVFTPPTSWTLIEFNFSDAAFSQQGWGTAVAKSVVLANAKDIHFTTVGGPITMADLWIDNIEIFGCTTQTPTNTPVNTLT
ncbi:MAG TPA: CIA30 family protein, partial [Candidatus Goldiibacteriota bacterium]|nr:CIA30 family protein [Candidatus Goldiibacteriota bacterium]